MREQKFHMYLDSSERKIKLGKLGDKEILNLLFSTLRIRDVCHISFVHSFLLSEVNRANAALLHRLRYHHAPHASRRTGSNSSSRPSRPKDFSLILSAM